MSEKELNPQRVMKLTDLEPELPKSSVFIWLICIGLLVFLVWAWVFKLEEVKRVQARSFLHLKSKLCNLWKVVF